jgi:hypothetical protein
MTHSALSRLAIPGLGLIENPIPHFSHWLSPYRFRTQGLKALRLQQERRSNSN